MAQKFANNAVSQLASAITDSQTQFAVLPGGGGKFPILATGDWFMATMTGATSDGGVQREIVKVNVRGSDQFTVDRGQEGTQALPFAAGTIIDARWTAGSAQAVSDSIKAVSDATTAARAVADAAVKRGGDTMTGSLMNSGFPVDQYGAFRSLSAIGGSFASWNAAGDNLRKAVVQIDAPDNTGAYMLARWTKWNARHIAAIDAYSGGSDTSDPTINFHVGATTNAWSFSNSTISRAGLGGTVYGTWNLNPVVAQGGGNYGYVRNISGNSVVVYWDNGMQGQVDGQYQGRFWTTNNFDPGSKANNGSQCQKSAGGNYFGNVNGNPHLPNPWCIDGLEDPGNGRFGEIRVYGCWFRNQ